MADTIAHLVFNMSHFLRFGGFLPFVVFVAIVVFAVAREPVWLASVVAAGYAAYATFLLFQIPALLEANTVGQIYGMAGLFGGLLLLTMVALVGGITKFFLIRKSSRQLETSS